MTINLGYNLLIFNINVVIIITGKATFADKPRREKYNLSSKKELQEWTNEYPWVAPELLEDKVPPSRSTDAYSYGFICSSVCRRTHFKDESVGNIWTSLYRSEPRAELSNAVNGFHQII